MKIIFKKLQFENKRALSQLVDFRLTKIRNIFAWRQPELSPRRKFTTGFTLVETLVAVSILMLSVTGPLYYASESLKAAVYARDQITAFYLAQDAFEQIRKIRDDNASASNSWNHGLSSCETACRVNADGFFYSIDTSTLSDENKYLYRSDTGVYSHVNTGTKTIFQRTVKITPTDGIINAVTNLPTWTNATEMKVTVDISWNSRGTARNFEAYVFLRNFK